MENTDLLKEILEELRFISKYIEFIEGEQCERGDSRRTRFKRWLGRLKNSDISKKTEDHEQEEREYQKLIDEVLKKEECNTLCN